jgi:hypothetical protein
MRSKIKKTVGDHDLVETSIKITPCLMRSFVRYSLEKGKNINNMASLAHGIRMTGVALLKKYGIATPEKLSVNYQ